MRRTSLAAALALLVAGCGLDRATAPEDPGPTVPQPEVVAPEPDFAAAAVATNLWTTKAPMPTARPLLCGRRGERRALRRRRLQGRRRQHSHGGSLQPGQQQLDDPGPAGDARLLERCRYHQRRAVRCRRQRLEHVTRTLFAYTPSTNTWTTKAPMPVGGGCGASGVIGGRLYVYSGATRGVVPALRSGDQQLEVTWRSRPTPHRSPLAGVHRWEILPRRRP